MGSNQQACKNFFSTSFGQEEDFFWDAFFARGRRPFGWSFSSCGKKFPTKTQTPKNMKEADPLLVTPVKQTKAASELGLSDDDLDNIDAALEAGRVRR